MKDTLTKLAKIIKEKQGRLFLVGGTVRDELLGIEPKDFDCECFGVEENHLDLLLKNFALEDNLVISEVGKSFKVWKLRNDAGFEFDVSLPREDLKEGKGHKGFRCIASPSMSYEKAASRRDVSINAIMKDVLTGEIIDPFNGQEDIKNKTLRMVSPTSFQEDSLRVLRLAQFASRLNFEIETETKVFAQQTDLSDLPKERIWGELEKMFLKSRLASLGIEYLFDLNITEKLFPSLKYNNSVQLSLMSADYTNLTAGEKLAVLITLLTLDSGKEVLDELGLSSVDGYNVRKQVELLREHLPKGFLDSDYEFHRLSQSVSMKLTARVLSALGYGETFTSTVKRLGIEDEPLAPILMGKHLIEMGLTPSPEFGKILDKVYDRQIRGEITSLEEAKKFVHPSWTNEIINL